MSKKIKLLSVAKKKPRKETNNGWEETVNYYAPDMYELLRGVGEKDTLEKVKEQKPEIVLILSDMADNTQLAAKIKQIHPETAIFVVLGMVADEQELIDAFMAEGVYKCYPQPVSMDALFHDMFVALNLE